MSASSTSAVATASVVRTFADATAESADMTGTTVRESRVRMSAGSSSTRWITFRLVRRAERGEASAERSGRATGGDRAAEPIEPAHGRGNAVRPRGQQQLGLLSGENAQQQLVIDDDHAMSGELRVGRHDLGDRFGEIAGGDGVVHPRGDDRIDLAAREGRRSDRNACPCAFDSRGQGLR